MKSKKLKESQARLNKELDRLALRDAVRDQKSSSFLQWSYVRLKDKLDGHN